MISKKQQQQQASMPYGIPQRKSDDPAGAAASFADPVVANLPRSPHGYSAVSLAPDRQHAVTASNDTIQIVSIGPSGMEIVQTIPFAPYAKQKGAAVDSSKALGVFAPPGKVISPFHRMGENLFEPHKPSSPANQISMNAVITDVAWSSNLSSAVEGPNSSALSSQHHGAATFQHQQQHQQQQPKANSFVAAAGSNGVVAIWESKKLLEKTGHRPEIVLAQHTRAVSRLSWHPKRPMVLSASLDSTVRLWERRKASRKPNADAGGRNVGKNQSIGFPFFGGGTQGAVARSGSDAAKNYSWQCTGVFEPRTEAVRDIEWSPFLDDIFALVTSSGSLVVYNRFLRAKCMVKISAHNGFASSLSWHPTQKYTIATGGSNDRLVKVWDLQSSLKLDGPVMESSIHMSNNQNTVSSRGAESIQSMDSDVFTDSSGHSYGSKANINTFGSSSNNNPLSRQPPIHTLSVAASVNRIKWRPPAFSSRPQTETTESYGTRGMDALVGSDKGETSDRHDSMLVVATAPLKGETSGGAGLVALWSYHRPYMPLRVVEGHKEGAVVDFVWLKTPVTIGTAYSGKSSLFPSRPRSTHVSNSMLHQPNHQMGEVDSPFSTDPVDTRTKEGAIWQHVLSVGKDGRCLIQSLVRGDRPISKVPPSCFAMANLSPFQRGCGSLQIFSVTQNVPSSRQKDFGLTALRQDRVIASAPGIFREEGTAGASDLKAQAAHQKIPEKRPTITFNEVDYGDLDSQGEPSSDSDALVVAPEVVHCSRFAAMYVLHPSTSQSEGAYPNRVSLCLHNSDVAQRLKVEHLAHMWRMIAIMLENAGIDSLADVYPANLQDPFNAIQYAIVPTIQSILEDCANDGDVQTCVSVCEVLQVLDNDENTRIPDLEIQLVREWYLSYIDLLRDMCLFSHANAVIRNCNDPVISGLNKKSTTISESCPHCGKPLHTDGEMIQEGRARSVCKSCHRRVGKCFVCHLPVKGMYVWCPGCGHGGHLEHALSWFGGEQQLCPTGCGHKCANVLQTCVTIPRTQSMREVGD